MTDFIPKRSEEYFLTSRPVIGLKDEYPAAFVDPAHSHQRAQLLFAKQGIMSVVTEENTFAVPPQRALWLGAGIQHEVSCRSHVSLRTLYVDTGALPRMTTHCRLVEVSPLLESLIIEVVNFDTTAAVQRREALIVELLLSEIWSMPAAPYQVRMPTDKRLRRACAVITRDPTDRSSLDDFARTAYMSRRTFTRLFKRETGMSFANWRQQMRLMEALSLIGSGRPITQTALDVGYNSASAFTVAFQRTFGRAPSEYRVH